MKQSTHNSAVPAAIIRKLQLVQKRSMLVQVACALVAAFAVLLAAMGVAMLIDWLATLYDSRWRVVLTTVAISAAVCTSVGWIFVAWRRAKRLERVATEVDRQEPRLEERWTTMTRLGDDATKPHMVHPAMLRRLSSEAASWEPRIEPDQVVSLSTLMRSLIALTAVTAVLAIAVVIDTREVTVLVRRFWAPASSISATKLVDVPGNIVIARGEPLALNATVDGRPVETATLFLQAEEKPAQSITLVAERSSPVGFSHRVRSVDEPFTYRFRAGDGQTEWYNVDVADRPEIESLTLTVTPPAYTRQKPKTFERLPERLSALKNSRIELAIRAKSPVETAQLKMDNNQSVTLSPDADGWYRWSTTLAQSSSITPVLTEKHGLTNRRQTKCELIAYEDQPPVVKVLTPNDRMAVRPEDAVEITFSATDDVGIGSAELVVYQEGNQQEPVELAAIPIDLGDQQGAKSIQQSVDLDLKKFGSKDGAELSYEVRVREDRGDSPPRIASRPSGAAQAAKQQKASAQRDKASAKTANQQASSQSSTTNSNSQSASSDPSAQASTSAASSGKSQNAQSSTPQNNNQQASAPTSPSSATPGSPMPEGADQKPLVANSEAKPDGSPASSTDQQPPPNTLAESKSNPAANSPNSPAPASKTTSPASSSASASSTPTSPSAPSSSTNPPLAKNDPKAAPAMQPKSAPEAPQPQTASSGRQSVDPNKQSGSQQPPSAQQASAPPASNPSDAKNSAAAGKPQPPASTPPAGVPATSQMAKSPPQSPTKSPAKNPAEPPEARMASSGRQSLSANSDPNSAEQPTKADQASDSPNQKSNPADQAAAMKQAQAADQKPPTNTTAQSPSKNSNNSSNPNSNQSQASASQSQSPSGKQPPQSDQSKTASSEQTPPPGDNMARRSLDVPQTASSQRMRLKVDQWAGSFEGQQRAKLEMAIDPALQALDDKLAKAQRTSRGVLDGLEADRNWLPAYDRELSNTQQLVADGKEIIEKLAAQSKDTPYAFIGLQVADLGVAHLEPAREGFWSALQSKGNDRTGSVRDGWQHLGRARQLLADLRGQFERSRRDFQLAESVERAKKMFQVYVENSHALLDVHDDDPNRYNRKMAEFDLDEEYLKRLKEVIKMRQDLEAELARILGEDPRLLRRYMDNIRAKSHNLREQLADLTAKQEGLNREVRAWAAFGDADRKPMAKLLLLQNLQESAALATSMGELQDRYQSWLPLQKDSQNAALAAVSRQIQDTAAAAGELKSRAANYIALEQKATATPPAAATAPAAPQTAEAPTAEATPPVAVDNSKALDEVIAQSEVLYSQLGQLEVSLRQLASREDNANAATFAGNRLTQTRQLIADSTAWIRQIKAHKAGSYTGAAEVTQYRLAMKTDEIAGKLSNLEQALAAGLQRTDQTLPQPIADKSRELMAALDKEAAPAQLAAVYALHSNQLPRSTDRQQVAGAALVKAEKLYDELMRLAITEMDKLPVQDPIASLLEDPTLDELLAQLEQELPLQELLGIPNRPSNLRIIGDWMRPGNNGGGGGMRRIALNQMKQNDKQSQQKLNQAYQKAIARALKETAPKRTAKVAKSAKLSDWNKLVSHLGNDLNQGRDKAPPEQYRQAIEQYFAQISRAVAEQEKKSP